MVGRSALGLALIGLALALVVHVCGLIDGATPHCAGVCGPSYGGGPYAIGVALYRALLVSAGLGL